jgi:hypothetical protein
MRAVAAAGTGDGSIAITSRHMFDVVAQPNVPQPAALAISPRAAAPVAALKKGRIASGRR